MLKYAFENNELKSFFESLPSWHISKLTAKVETKHYSELNLWLEESTSGRGFEQRYISTIKEFNERMLGYDYQAESIKDNNAQKLQEHTLISPTKKSNAECDEIENVNPLTRSMSELCPKVVYGVSGDISMMLSNIIVSSDPIFKLHASNNIS